VPADRKCVASEDGGKVTNGKGGESPIGSAQSLISLLDRGSLNLVVAFRANSSAGVAYDLLKAELDDAFTNDVHDLLEKSLGRYSEDEPLKKDPDRELRSGEWFEADIGVMGMQNVAAALSSPTSLAQLNLSQLDTRTPAWYSFVARDGASQWAAFIRRSGQFDIAKRGKLIARFRDQTLVRVHRNRRQLAFDDKFDLVLEPGRVLVAQMSAFDALFTDREAMAAEVPRQVGELKKAGIDVKNAKDLVSACQRNLVMMKKLARIVDSGYIAEVTPVKVRSLVEEFAIPGRVIEEGAFVFDKKNRWTLLKILDDDYLRSPLTRRKYESSAKVTVISKR
jgi:Domain of unknown function (DUF4868)